MYDCSPQRALSIWGDILQNERRGENMLVNVVGTNSMSAQDFGAIKLWPIRVRGLLPLLRKPR